MRVKFFGSIAVAFDDYNQMAKIEGYMYRLLLQELRTRQKTSKKSETVLIREVVQAWPRNALKWVEAQEANK